MLCSAVEHPAVRESARAAAHAGADVARAAGRPRRRRSTSTRWRARSSSRVHAGRGHDGQQRDRRRRSRSATSWRRCGGERPQAVRLHRRRPGRALARPGRGHRRRRPGVAQRPQGRGAGRRRRAGRGPRVALDGAPARRRAGARAAAAGPRTWPARSGWPRRCGSSRPSEPQAAAAGGRTAGPPGQGLLAAVAGVHRTVPAGVAVLPGHLHLCLPGVEREELLVALGARGGVRLGRVVVRQRGARAEPRARRHGRRARAGRRRRPLHARVRHRPMPTSSVHCASCPAVVAALRRAGAEHPVAHWSHAGARGHVGRRRLLRRGRAPGGAGP